MVVREKNLKNGAVFGMSYPPNSVPDITSLISDYISGFSNTDVGDGFWVSTNDSTCAKGKLKGNNKLDIDWDHNCDTKHFALCLYYS